MLNAPTRVCSRCGKEKPNWPTTRSLCPECNREYNREWRKKHPERVAGYREHGASAEEQARIVVRQRGLCAGCEQPLPVRRRHYVDRRGKEIAGVLCGNCAMILGLAHDDPLVLQSLAHYLVRTM